MIKEYLQEAKDAIDRIDPESIEGVINLLDDYRKGRLFIVGSGGSAGNASHAVADFRKLCNIEAYAFDNISELTARVNDEGWDTSYMEWLKVSKFSGGDCLFVLSVGGGFPNVSGNLVEAIKYADNKCGGVVGIVGNKDSYLAQFADAYIYIDTKDFKTPIVEGLQVVLFHLLVTKLSVNKPVW